LELIGLGTILSLGTGNSIALDAANAQVSGSTNVLNSSAMVPLLDLFVKKGFVTQEEADQVKAEAEAEQTNSQSFLQESLSKWKISDGTVNMELFGDVRLRYEDRQAQDPQNGFIELQRERYAVRVGLRGTLFDSFYYGVRVETSSNPRSPFVTAGTSASGVPYQGPFGKSTAGINIGQAYIGWQPWSWLNITLGKMPNPLYTTPMVWSPSLNPEGASEQFKDTVGEADIFANFGQFLYQDTNPNRASPGYFGQGSLGNGQGAFQGGGQQTFLIAWQLGVKYHVTKDVLLTVAPVLYYYTAVGADVNTGSGPLTPGFSDTYVGQGAMAANNEYAQSWSGYPSGPYDGYYSDQTGINDLMVLEIPAQLKFNLWNLTAQIFGDYAYNFEGANRAQAAFSAANTLSQYFIQNLPAAGGTVQPITSAQTQDVKAYQVGFGLGSSNLVYTPTQGLVYGNSSARHAWEFRAYWQHVEQYALDPNLLDTDFFAGDENLQGFYAAFAYAFSANVIGTFRYGHATRINDNLGTGGSGQDIPQMNPVNTYQIMQVDMTVRF